MESAHTFQKSHVKLNVGGHRFETSLQTLTSVSNTYFASMFSGSFPLTPADDGHYFIDRDGRHFHHVLNYLRNCFSLEYLTKAEKKELEVECEYYGLENMMVPPPETAMAVSMELVPPLSPFEKVLSVFSVAFNSSGTRLATGNQDKTVRVWDWQNKALVATLVGHLGEVQSVAFHPTNDKWLVSGSDDETVRVWDWESGMCVDRLDVEHPSMVWSVAFDPTDGTRVASGCGDQVWVWKGVLGFEYPHVVALDGHEFYVNSVAFNPNGTRLVSGSDDKTVRVWDAMTGLCTATLEGHSENVNSVAFSSDGARIASGSVDKTVRVWDALTGLCTATLEGHSGGVNSVAFSPDGARIASGSDDKTVRVWDWENQACVTTLDANSRVNTVVFIPHDTRLAMGCDDGTVRIVHNTSRSFF